MTLIHAAERHRIDDANRPEGCKAASAGMFVIRDDGTGRFDRHYHDVDEYWFVASGAGTIMDGEHHHEVGPGDIIYTRAGDEHDIVAVHEQLTIFWLTWEAPEGTSAAHLHRKPEYAAKHLVPVGAFTKTRSAADA